MLLVIVNLEQNRVFNHSSLTFDVEMWKNIIYLQLARRIANRC